MFLAFCFLSGFLAIRLVTFKNNGETNQPGLTKFATQALKRVGGGETTVLKMKKVREIIS